MFFAREKGSAEKDVAGADEENDEDYSGEQEGAEDLLARGLHCSDAFACDVRPFRQSVKARGSGIKPLLHVSYW